MTYVHALLGWYLDLLLYLTISTLVRHLLVPILEWPLWADLLVFLVFSGNLNVSGNDPRTMVAGTGSGGAVVDDGVAATPVDEPSSGNRILP